MSTLTWKLEGATAPSANAKPKSSRIGRLIKAYEDRAERRAFAYLAYLVHMDDALLRSLGFTDIEINALRKGELRLPR